MMNKIVFLAHIPTLRIDAESLPFSGGDLWRMPFDEYCKLTGGSFASHQGDYDATSPVFYRVQADVELPVTADEPGFSRAIEIKAPSDNWSSLESYGMGYVEGFHASIVDPAWAALVLSAPSALFLPPRLSVTFLVSLGNFMFQLGDQKARILHIQGNSDQEYLFLSSACSTPLPSERVSAASSLAKLIPEVQKTPELAAALASLLAISVPTVTQEEQLTLSVIALEALLLPDVRSGLAKTFATRLASLLASDQSQFQKIREIGAELYDARSSALHGEAPRSADRLAEATECAYAQQLLAEAIQALVSKLNKDNLLDSVRSSLDHFRQNDYALAQLPDANPPSLRRPDRLAQPSPSAVFVAASTMASMNGPEGMLLSWSPLVSLYTADTFSIGEEGDPLFPVIMPLTGIELLSMEDRDIRRDFAQLINDGHPISVLTTIVAKLDRSYTEREIDLLLRVRDVAVLALRLAGVNMFYDPALLGSYIYDGYLRLRRPTVFRQTILQMLRREPEGHISSKDATMITPFWRLLKRYNASARHVEIDRVLEMFRRVFDQRFLPVVVRAGLAFGALESMFGRFRRRGDKTQLEDMVVKVVGSDSPEGRWFTQYGRQFRNMIAHGSLQPDQSMDQALAHTCNILQASIAAYVRKWVDLDDQSGQTPATLFVNSLRNL